ncbi:MAG TPA: dephospho-CoA kinase [Candidatus Limnocylindrales bacterium]
MTVRIGLTGPIGCGKSTIAGWLAELGAVVVDADDIAQQVTARGEPAHDLVLDRFGAVVRAPDGSLDRPALASIVFADPAALADLERIVHPAVRPRILAALDAAARSAAPAVVVEAIKLVESGLADLCDEVWLVTCDPVVQRRRLLDRGTVAADAERRMATQAGLAARIRPRATRVIDASADEATTRSAVAAAWAALRSGSG